MPENDGLPLLLTERCQQLVEVVAIIDCADGVLIDFPHSIVAR